jgi:hypothetical protein
MVNLNSNYFCMGPHMLDPHIKYLYEPSYVRATYMLNISDVPDVCYKNIFGCCICCNGYTRMLKVYVSNISVV